MIRATLSALVIASFATSAALAGDATTPAPAPSPSSNAERFPTPSPLPDGPELPGDETRDCASLYAESKYRLSQNDKINQQALDKKYVKGAGTKALETVGALGGMVPVLGGLISMGAAMGQMGTTKADAERNYGELNRKSDWALDRMVYVSDLYRNRCIRGAK